MLLRPVCSRLSCSTDTHSERGGGGGLGCERSSSGGIGAGEMELSRDEEEWKCNNGFIAFPHVPLHSRKRSFSPSHPAVRENMKRRGGLRVNERWEDWGGGGVQRDGILSPRSMSLTNPYCWYSSSSMDYFDGAKDNSVYWSLRCPCVLLLFIRSLPLPFFLSGCVCPCVTPAGAPPFSLPLFLLLSCFWKSFLSSCWLSLSPHLFQPRLPALPSFNSYHHTLSSRVYTLMWTFFCLWTPGGPSTAPCRLIKMKNSRGLLLRSHFLLVFSLVSTRVQWSRQPWTTLCPCSLPAWWALSPSRWTICPWALQEVWVPAMHAPKHKCTNTRLSQLRNSQLRTSQLRNSQLRTSQLRTSQCDQSRELWWARYLWIGGETTLRTYLITFAKKTVFTSNRWFQCFYLPICD